MADELKAFLRKHESWARPAAGAVGAIGGTLAGGAAGSALLPGPGTIAGGTAGGILGQTAGDKVFDKAAGYENDGPVGKGSESDHARWLEHFEYARKHDPEFAKMVMHFLKHGDGKGEPNGSVGYEPNFGVDVTPLVTAGVGAGLGAGASHVFHRDPWTGAVIGGVAGGALGASRPGPDLERLAQLLRGESHGGVVANANDGESGGDPTGHEEWLRHFEYACKHDPKFAKLVAGFVGEKGPSQYAAPNHPLSPKQAARKKVVESSPVPRVDMPVPFGLLDGDLVTNF